MYGPPPIMSPKPPARRVTAGRVVGWVLLSGCLIGGVGLFACVPLAVLAVRSRTRRDVLLAVAALVFAVLACVVTAQNRDPNHPGPLADVVSLGLLAQGIATTVYYIRCDRRRTDRRRAPFLPVGGPIPAPQPYQAYQSNPAYQPHQPYQAYGGQPLVADAVPRSDAVPPADATPPGPPPAMPTVALPVAPMPAQPDRLGQVRAELDELSDYLRKEQGS